MKTKNKRLIVVFVTICVIVFFSLFSSQIFKLKSVEVSFYNENGTQISNLKNNYYFNTTERVNNIVLSTKFDYGNLVFLINKSNYTKSLESNNPYLKLKNIEVKFPNKLIVNISERKPIFFIKSAPNVYLLDSDFKLLEILEQDKLSQQNLIKLQTITSQQKEIDFFNFFEVLPTTYEAGQNMRENNKVLQAVSSLPNMLQNYVSSQGTTLANLCKAVSFTEVQNKINLIINTISPYGINLVVEDIFTNFNYKFNKLLNALSTLKLKEPIKCTFGNLKIDMSCNCYWYNL